MNPVQLARLVNLELPSDSVSQVHVHFRLAFICSFVRAVLFRTGAVNTRKKTYSWHSNRSTSLDALGPQAISYRRT
jgi:hypothetical protein